MDRSTVLKIAINGCGIAGPALAWWLRYHGHEPVLFEEEAGLRQGGYVIDFWGTGFDVAEKMGILDKLKDSSCRVDRVRTVTSGGWTTSCMNTRVFHEMTGGRYMSIARSDLSRHLFEACDGVETHFGTSVVGIEKDEQQVRARLSDGHEESFDLVVGADGLHSTIRELTFGPRDQFEKPLGFCVAAFVLPGYRPREEAAYVSHTVPGRQVSRVALRDDQTLILFVFTEELADGFPTDEAEERAALRSIFKDAGWEAGAILECLDGVENLYFDRISQIRMPEWHRGRVVLLGDAAACASLLAGEGTGLAMTEAYVLAGELARKPVDVHAALAAYQRQLHGYVTEKQDRALGFADMFAPKSWRALVVRDLSLNLIAVPILGKRLLENSFRSDLLLPDYGAGA